ncbi:MAG: hypothetical protein K8R88_02295 [Armatimonadetes bacterium]|nr:hypothetical protein [Armatimonadota bacterium]
MKDIQDQDRKLFFKELLQTGRLVGLGALGFFCWLVFSVSRGVSWPVLWFTMGLGIWLISSYFTSKKNRFLNSKFKQLWRDCEDRDLRLQEAMKENRRRNSGSWEELPKTIEGVSHNLYVALRRADLVSYEIAKSEGWLLSRGSATGLTHHTSDPQAQELYKLADKNLAEYKQAFQTVLATVQRTEAQAAVFVTTLDSMRLRMLGHRLSPRKADMDSLEFLNVMNEAKLQLAAIDKALDELDMQPIPKMIATMSEPPPLPDEVHDQVQNNS